MQRHQQWHTRLSTAVQGALDMIESERLDDPTASTIPSPGGTYLQRALQLLSNLITQDQTLLGLIQEHPALDGIDLHQHVVAHSMALRTRRGSSLMTVAE